MRTGTCTGRLFGCCMSPLWRVEPPVGEEPKGKAVPGDDPGAGGALTADDCVTLHSASAARLCVPLSLMQGC